MGGVVSSGENNEELVDNLCKEGYILTPEVEKVFRIVDRQKYMIFDGEDENPLEAYEDHAWRKGNLHLSAPCIYTKAMEALKLGLGQSFLNIGSGTGYFSTMAGLMLGPSGTNHGIEIFEDNIEFAEERLKEFKEESPWYDPADFCEPHFIAGNALLLSPSGILYDRIYCGAACPSQHVQLLKNLLKIDGILVMPCENCLLSVTHLEEQTWNTETILNTVSFAPLILPSGSTVGDMKAIAINSTVSSLKDHCRLAILSALQRKRYSLIPTLPIPSHLQNFLSLGRSWDEDPENLKKLCPLDPAEIGKGDEGEEGDNPRNIVGRSPATICHINNGRSLILNINGMLIQLPIESDEGSSAEEEENEDDPT